MRIVVEKVDATTGEFLGTMEEKDECQVPAGSKCMVKVDENRIRDAEGK